MSAELAARLTPDMDRARLDAAELVGEELKTDAYTRYALAAGILAGCVEHVAVMLLAGYVDDACHLLAVALLVDELLDASAAAPELAR